MSMTLEFTSQEDAKKMADSVRLDNGEYISTTIQGKKLICLANSDTLGGLLHTAEDFLSCISLADKMLRAKRSK